MYTEALYEEEKISSYTMVKLVFVVYPYPQGQGILSQP